MSTRDDHLFQSICTAAVAIRVRSKVSHTLAACFARNLLSSAQNLSRCEAEMNSFQQKIAVFDACRPVFIILTLQSGSKLWIIFANIFPEITSDW